MNNRFKTIVIMILVASMAIMSVGCYGSFNLTKKVYNWNGTMEGKWVKELVFLVLNIVPVYGVAATLDVVILNSIEFWTGNNPMASNITTEDGTTVTFNAEKKEMTISYAGKTFNVSNENGKATVKNEQGTVLAYCVSSPDGGMNITDANGTILTHYTADQVSGMLASK
ncbi:MAG: DUF3332 family protein [Bacteroidota bacterium]|jgi:hypothetical protein